MDYISHYASDLGPMTMASDGEHLIGLWFDDQQHFGSTIQDFSVKDDLPVFQDTVRWLDLYFSGRNPDFIPSLLLRGTEFRKTVWTALQQIPYGQTVTYGQVGNQLELPGTCARAIGGAVGHNPISLIIPCHRVIGQKGTLSGYAGGVRRKARLLQMEQCIFLK